jgi:hypothetical protein
MAVIRGNLETVRMPQIRTPSQQRASLAGPDRQG